MESPGKSERLNSSTILDLNDDCLLEVFKHLDLNDLCVVANVCRRFRQNSQTHYVSSKYKDCILHIEIFREFCSLELRNPDEVNALFVERFGDAAVRLRFLYVSKVLRNFGKLIKSIVISNTQWGALDNNGSYGPIRPKHPSFDAEADLNGSKVLLDLTSLYCSETLIQLELKHCHLTDTAENAMRSLFQHLQKLKLYGCTCSESFGRMLSLWSPNLRELHLQNVDMEYIGNIGPEHILRHRFPELMTISLNFIPTVTTNDFEEFLKLNPQLKRIAIVNCLNIDGGIFQVIAKHMPSMEAIQIDRVYHRDDSTFNCVGQLNNLHTLKLCNQSRYEMDMYPLDHSFMPLILHKIRAANIPLQHLHLFGGERWHKELSATEQIVAAISNLTTLKTLTLFGFKKLKMSHILGICEELIQLSELTLRKNEIHMTVYEVIEIIRRAQYLQLLKYSEEYHSYAYQHIEKWCYNELPARLLSYSRIREYFLRLEQGTELPESIRIYNGRKRHRNAVEKSRSSGPAREESLATTNKLCNTIWDLLAPINIDAYMEMVEIVKKRQERRYLSIELDNRHPMDANIPKDLRRMYNDTLSIVGFVPRWYNNFDFHRDGVLTFQNVW